MSSLKTAIQIVLSKNQGITKDEVFNYIKYQNLCPDELIDIVNIHQLLDNLVMNSVIEKKLVNEKYLYYLIKPISDTNKQEENTSHTSSNTDHPNMGLPNMSHPPHPNMGHPNMSYPNMGHPPHPNMSHPNMSYPPHPNMGHPNMGHPPHPNMGHPHQTYYHPSQSQPPQHNDNPVYMSNHPVTQQNDTHSLQKTSYNGEEVFGDVTTKSVKKMVYTENWKDCAGRENGSDGYQFGDVSRTVLKSLFATS